MDLKIEMKNGKTYELTGVTPDKDEIMKRLTKNRFVYFGQLIVNTHEISTIEMKP